jgi:hypothetical protein
MSDSEGDALGSLVDLVEQHRGWWQFSVDSLQDEFPGVSRGLVMLAVDMSAGPVSCWVSKHLSPRSMARLGAGRWVFSVELWEQLSAHHGTALRRSDEAVPWSGPTP